MRKLLTQSLLALAFTSLALAQDQDKDKDRHFASVRLAAICQNSAFLHGYLHGYEHGFHAADLALHMGRQTFAPPDKIDLDDYRGEFGDKQVFRAGYRSGLLSGYSDGIAGRSFRAVEAVLETAAVSAEAGGNPSFDHGLAVGYRTGQTRGLSDGRKGASFEVAEASCPSKDERAGSEFCSGFSRGYRMGYSDGYLNQRDYEEKTSARNR